jgi:CheY-like chemotaxis protein
MIKNRKILVIDDQEDLREQLAKLLRKAGQKNETHSLVEQMRARLLGKNNEEKSDVNPDEEKSSYIVDTAAQGKEAWEMVKEANSNDDSYAVMFLDMRMPPGWDGLETATKIREIDKNIEIVIMTAYADHDQKEISEKVGMPEKLLYIKKPFQPEEIYQLALSLTSKYSLEKTEKNRKIWLESLLRGLSKLKSSSSTNSEIFSTVLKAILNFTQSKDGFIAELSSESEKWVNYHSEGATIEDAKKYFEENEKLLKESRTTQKVENKYILPLRKDDFFAVAVIDNVKTSTDPEWYKLLSLLIMTCSEVLNNNHVNSLNGNKSKASILESLKSLLEAIKTDSNSINSDNMKSLTTRITNTANSALDEIAKIN